MAPPLDCLDTLLFFLFSNGSKLFIFSSFPFTWISNCSLWKPMFFLKTPNSYVFSVLSWHTASLLSIHILNLRLYHSVFRNGMPLPYDSRLVGLIASQVVRWGMI